eukprot:CAMPEP_0184368766 /NCGR_PEP_ID=MMETSP1089-20130417/161857_1 /TAXON_ID=38269 ORGANISM="Gloeochaete wittrockiana, Strain SAG46.84" /NCGR_SAMPLE_ID=MMETSP1089 /ASSEMBLY_ACC=CAM_ASM_000445 /LENGTH=50 /DNA_ID=CAMNT_0026711107 /DNA_START=671 /DNA_END=820 /DNA_ORIENTATION=-
MIKRPRASGIVENLTSKPLSIFLGGGIDSLGLGGKNDNAVMMVYEEGSLW